jgi:hypothetical protein
MAARPDEAPPAITGFLAQFSGPQRAEALHLALKALRARVEPDRVLMCELAWELHRHGYWSRLHRDDGSPYDSEETYFREVLGLSSWRTAYKRFAIGRMLSNFPEPALPAIRAAIAQVGVAKATVIVPAVERTGDWERWTGLARQLAYPVLQARVSAALAALPRGPEPSPPGERFRRAVLSAMPDIDAMEVVERFFAIGTKVVGSRNPVAIFLAGCRECLADWEVHAAHGRAGSASPREPCGEGLDKATESAVGDRGPESTRGFYSRGQTGRGRNGHGAS